MAEFLDFTRDDTYLGRQLQRVKQTLDSAEHQCNLAGSLNAKRVHAEQAKTYQWMIDQIETELARRKTRS